MLTRRRSKNTRSKNKRPIFSYGPDEKFETALHAYFQGLRILRQFTFAIHSLYMKQGEDKERAKRAVWTQFFKLPQNTYNNTALKEELISYLPHIVVPSSLEFTKELEARRTAELQSVLSWLGYKFNWKCIV